MAAATEKNNFFESSDTRLAMRVLDCYSLRTVFDVLKGYRENIILRFSSTGVKIIECGSSETSTQQYEIFADEMLHYSFPLHTYIGEGEDRRHSVYPIAISAGDAFATLKIDGKKEPVYIYTTINPKTMNNNGLYFVRSSASTTLEGINHISTKPVSSSLPDIKDYYGITYKGKAPNSKIPTAAFVKAFSNIKSRGCNVLSFELNDNGAIIIKGKQDTKVITAFPLPAGDSDITEEDPQEEEDDEDETLQFGDMSFVIDDASARYSIDLMVSNVLWFLKIGRLANTSILKIYLAKDSPLLMRTALGLYGMATFSFNSDVR